MRSRLSAFRSSRWTSSCVALLLRMTRGLVYAEPGARPAVEEITLDPPGAGEVQVRVEACGVCHTDLHVVETGGWGMKFPILLGHEGAGFVEEVGDGVTSVAVGDRVVIAWRAPCGDSCRSCVRGDPRRCSNNLRARRRMHRAADGALLNAVLRCGTFADRVIVHEAVDASAGDAVSQVRGLTDGVDYAFSAITSTAGLVDAVRMCAYGGTATLVGVPPSGRTLDVDVELDLFHPKVAIAVTHGGDTIPQQDFPFLAQAALDGKLDLERFVTRTIELEEVPDAL